MNRKQRRAAEKQTRSGKAVASPSNDQHGPPQIERSQPQPVRAVDLVHRRAHDATEQPWAKMTFRGSYWSGSASNSQRISRTQT